MDQAHPVNPAPHTLKAARRWRRRNKYVDRVHRLQIKSVEIRGGLSWGAITPWRFYKNIHFAIEAPRFHLHLGVARTKHPDKEKLIEVTNMPGEPVSLMKSWELSGSGMPPKYHGSLSGWVETRIGQRLSGSIHLGYEYGGLTFDWQEMDKKRFRVR